MSTDVNVNRNLTAEPAVTFGDWMLTIFLTAVPIVNIVMLLVWAFGQNTNESKKNWAKASLVWLVIAIVAWFVFLGALLSTIMSLKG